MQYGANQRKHTIICKIRCHDRSERKNKRKGNIRFSYFLFLCDLNKANNIAKIKPAVSLLMAF